MANLSVEEPDALMRARPDLWELWGSNAPEPPGPGDENARCVRAKANDQGAASGNPQLRDVLFDADTYTS